MITVTWDIPYRVSLFIHTFILKEDTTMVTFIAQKIEEAKDNYGTEAGQDKYRAYFVKKNAKKLYGRYQEDVDTILETDGYEDCIVAE